MRQAGATGMKLDLTTGRRWWRGCYLHSSSAAARQRQGPGKAPQRVEKIDSAPRYGMAPKAWRPEDLAPRLGVATLRRCRKRRPSL